MGQEIPTSQFSQHDFARFSRRLREETALFGQYLQSGRFDCQGAVGGFELEAWLVDRRGAPSPINEEFLKRLHSPLVVSELSSFNIEINGTPQPLKGRALTQIRQELENIWAQCRATAAQSAADLVAIGILPSVRETDLNLTRMSPSQRYRALNEQVLTLRRGAPLQLDIQGREHLCTTHHDVMLEAATTSFQIHLQVPADRAVRLYNAAIIAAAPMVAVSANAPFLFGHDLWDETRIPLFEQSVDIGATGHKRVTFGNRYAQGSLLECFEENLLHYPVLLPIDMDQDPGRFSHLRLHNGTIWRWNRPLVGFDSNGTPHLRIEHRVVPAGPSLIDSLANAAFFFGLAYALSNLPEPPEHRLEFAEARENFYKAARESLAASIHWFDSTLSPLQGLVTEQLIPVARTGLEQLGIAAEEIATYLDIIQSRAGSGQTGASWQRRWVARYGRDWEGLCRAYMERQRAGRPVHEWDY
ncbi:MAG TPA: glutamate--cysteine ligase [Gammaproteobacteria bacterium]|nr:glutamate--cysteine ligase [Gammaproteobacteria bacterium]